jgi:hypothetical protein
VDDHTTPIRRFLYGDRPVTLGEPDRRSRFGPADVGELGDLGHREEAFPSRVGLVSDDAGKPRFDPERR